MDKYALAYTTFEIISDGTAKQSSSGDVFKIDGEMISGHYITKITFEAEAMGKARVFIYGRKEKMTPFMQQRLAFIERV